VAIAVLMEPVTFSPGDRPSIFTILKTLRHNSRIHECHRPWNRRHQLSRHFGRVHDLGPLLVSRRKILEIQLLPELRLVIP